MASGDTSGQGKPTPEKKIHPDDLERTVKSLYKILQSGEIREIHLRWMTLKDAVKEYGKSKTEEELMADERFTRLKEELSKHETTLRGKIEPQFPNFIFNFRNIFESILMGVPERHEMEMVATYRAYYFDQITHEEGMREIVSKARHAGGKKK